MQWLQDPNQSNIDKLNNISRETSSHLRNKKQEYLKPNIDELETQKDKKKSRDLHRGIHGFMKVYQSRTSTQKSEKGDLATDSHSISVRWRNHFSQLLNVQGVYDVRQREIHTTQLIVPESSAFDVEIGIENLKRHKSPGINQIPAELTKVWGRKIRSEIHELINTIWHKEELLEEWKESVSVPIYNKGDKTDWSNYRSISLLPTTYKILSNILL